MLPLAAQDLDSLRASVGLVPIGEYVKLVEEVYGIPCIWDPALTVEALSDPAQEKGPEEAQETLQ